MISVRGARSNNLDAIDVDIPRGQPVVIVGPGPFRAGSLPRSSSSMREILLEVAAASNTRVAGCRWWHESIVDVELTVEVDGIPSACLVRRAPPPTISLLEGCADRRRTRSRQWSDIDDTDSNS